MSKLRIIGGVLVLLGLLLLSGCDEDNAPTPQPGASALVEKTEVSPYKNFSDQIVVRIKAEELDKWLMLNRNFEIVTMTSECLRGGDQNPTSHFVIVYKVRK